MTHVLLRPYMCHSLLSARKTSDTFVIRITLLGLRKGNLNAYFLCHNLVTYLTADN